MFFRCITSDMAAILAHPVLKELPESTYLAGGTAIALRYGHRISVDVDFFTPKDFDSLQWFERLRQAFGSIFTISVTKLEHNTLVATLNETGFSLFHYPYPLLGECVAAIGFPISVASMIDLACMKLIAVNQRGSCKDFIDLQWILEREGFSLDVLFSWVCQKYGVGEELLLQIRKSLVYFDDAERDLHIRMHDPESGNFILLSDSQWTSTKRFFERLIRQSTHIHGA